MPSSKNYVEVEKACEECQKPLHLKSNRDITRKRFCSRSCSNRASLRIRYANLEHKFCLSCGTSFKPKNNSQIYCSSKCLATKQVERSYKYLNENPRAYIQHLMQKPRRKHIPVEYILDLLHKQEGKCALSGIEMTFIKKTDGIKIHTNLSIDRIDSNLGYEVGNIQLVCAIVNIMKYTLSVEELVWWCSKIK